MIIEEIQWTSDPKEI